MGQGTQQHPPPISASPWGSTGHSVGVVFLQCTAQHGHSWCDRSTIPSMAGHVPSPHTAAWIHPYPLPSFSVAA